MTDRHNGYIVVLKEDIREDDAKNTLIALSMIEGVMKVEPIINDPRQQLAFIRARQELGEGLWHVLYPKREIIVQGKCER